MSCSSATGLLGEFLQRLLGTYRQTTDAAANRTLLTLTLAETMLGEHCLGTHTEDPVLQVAVIGPTQAGKSTVVNLLLGGQLAEASPLAAFTRELKGFVQTSGAPDMAWIQQIPGGEELHLQQVEGDFAPGLVVWDTPDFDSHRSQDYRTLIARVGGIADVIVLVVSKEKYSDLSVWETLDALRPLNRKLIVCLNKVSSDQEILSGALRERLQGLEWEMSDTPILVLPQTVQKDAYTALSRMPEAGMLRRAVLDPGHRCDRECRLHGLCGVIGRNWDEWLHPVLTELSAAAHWQREVDRRLDAAMATYEEQFLDHASHNDAFKQAVAQLLELLEIPVLAGPLTRVRSVLTWPLRKLTGLFDNEREHARGGAEAALLQDVLDHALLSLHTVIVRECDGTGQSGVWWRALIHDYPRESDNLKTAFGREIRSYQDAFEPEIEDAARSLYQRLQENPVVLNTLRVSRVGADTAGVLFAVKTGAVGLSDALLTPAMLSFTSMLAESAVGQYMDTVREKLLSRQRALVQAILRGMVRTTLTDIPQRSAAPGLFRISDTELDRAETAKRELCA